MQESQNCINFIKTWEKFLPNPTFDKVADIWNIGYGTTHYPNSIPVHKDDASISEETATKYLQYYVDECVEHAKNKITCNLSQCQFDALMCLAYNIGITKFIDSTILKVINQNPNNYELIKQEWMRWVYSKGKFVQGLKNRRIEELKMYGC